MLPQDCALDTHTPDLAAPSHREIDLAPHRTAEQAHDRLLIEVARVLTVDHEDLVAGEQTRERRAEPLRDIPHIKGAAVVVAPENRADRARLSGRRARDEENGEEEGSRTHTPTIRRNGRLASAVELCSRIPVTRTRIGSLQGATFLAFLPFFSLVFGLFAAAACALGDEDEPGCETDEACGEGYLCRAGACFRVTTGLTPPKEPEDAGDGGDEGG